MALDTFVNRYSVINLGSPWRGILPLPDGVLAQADRQTLAFLYAGILAGTGVAPEPQPPHTVATLISDAASQTYLFQGLGFGDRVDSAWRVDGPVRADSAYQFQNLISDADNNATLFDSPPTLDVEVETE